MLLTLMARIQEIRGQRVSFDDAIDDLAIKKSKKNKLSDLAGSWKMTDAEWKNIRNELKRVWKKWKIPSA